MMDVVGTLGALGQGQAAVTLIPSLGQLRSAPGVLSGLRFIDTAASVIGVERISGQLAKYAVKLALRGDQAAERIAAQMVDEMRARVPSDTGTLFNGISWRKEGRTIIVEATAVREGADYARWVEFGHHAGGHADGEFFDGGDAGAPLRRRPQSHPADVAPEPFFWEPARSGLSELRGEMARESRAAAREEGL